MAPSITSTTTAEQPLSVKVQNEEGHRPTEEKTSLQRLSHGVTLQGVPSFSSIELRRRWMLEHLAGAFRVFARKGYSEGLAGHISLRDPEHTDCFWTNPYGTHIGLVTVSDLILLNEDGEAVGGATHLPTNAAGFQIHSHLHKRHAHINAACHMHSKYGKAYSAFGQRLDMINQDSLNFYGDAHGVYQEFGGVVLNEEEGEKLANCLGAKGKGLVLQNHGLLTVGQTVDEAAYLYTLMERSCEVQLLADAAAQGSGKPKIIIGAEAAQFTFEATSDPDALYCSFQPDFQMELKLSAGDFLE